MHNPKQMAFANKNLSALKQSMTPVVLISALGYFVDIFDLAIFGIVRISSLQDIGVPKESILDQGILLINIQMGAMVLGGFFWGSLGDRLGRRSALFASIALYSLANFLNAFISSIEPYYLLRFLAGLGLAGEVGVGVTLIAESLPPRARGYGTMLFGCIGVSGTIAAALISSHFGWRVCYAVGGALGFALLLLRVKVLEPEIFSRIKMIGVDRGSLIKLLSNPRRARTYLACLLTGVPIYYVVGLLLNLSPELAQQMGVQGPIQLSTTSMLFSAGSVLGSLGCGALSEKLKSRKRAALAFLLFLAATIFSLLSLHEIKTPVFYLYCAALGFGTGYWVAFATLSTEQFGTDLRATATSTLVNLIRGAVIPLTLTFKGLKPHLGFMASERVLALTVLLLAITCLLTLPESFGKKLDFVESD